jgi:hypothetical protein
VGKEYGLEIKKQKQKINGKINGVYRHQVWLVHKKQKNKKAEKARERERLDGELVRFFFLPLMLLFSLFFFISFPKK